jgi:DNA repair protein RadC
MNDKIEQVGSNIGALYMGHNHPSGNVMFSEEDVLITRKIADLHKDLPWGVGDSMVITKDRNYASMDQLARLIPALSRIKFRGV